MTSPTKIGKHWALVEVERLAVPAPSWKARWALYADEPVAMGATSPSVKGTAASGCTALFETEEEAVWRAVEEASGSEPLPTRWRQG